MPWFAIPFALREIKYTLSAHFQGKYLMCAFKSRCLVEGIPTLILLDRFGNLISDSARSNVYTDPEAKSFPWTTSAALTDSTASTLTESDIQVNRSPATDTQTTVPSSTRTPASATTTAPTPATTTAPTPASVSTPAPTSTSVKKDVQEEEASEYEVFFVFLYKLTIRTLRLQKESHRQKIKQRKNHLQLSKKHIKE